jgi:ketosteroid isomerase-like protein
MNTLENTQERLEMEPEQVVREFYGLIDRDGVTACRSWLSDDCTLILNADPPIQGAEVIADHIVASQAAVGSADHQLQRLVVDPKASVVTAQIVVDYRTLSGKPVSVTGVSVVDVQGDRIDRLQIYAETSGLESAIEND